MDMPAVASGVVMMVLVGCAGEGGLPDQEAATVRDSSGVTIVENGRLDPAGGSIGPPTLALQIGVAAGADEYQLFRVSDAKRLADGAIAVANAGSQELRIYGADGTHRATAGGGGGGPQEFRYPQALVVGPGDTIQVQDFLDRVYFAPDGTFARRASQDRQAFVNLVESSGGFSEGGQWLPDGSYFAPIYEREGQGPPTPGPLRRPSMTLVRLSGDLSSVSELGQYGGIEQQMVEMGGRPGVSSIVPPFARSAVWALGSSDGTIVVANNDAPQLDRFHADGSRSLVRWTADPEPITAAEVEVWKDQQRNAEWTRGQLPELERGWAAMDLPESKAFYGRVGVGSDGTLWVGPVDYFANPTPLVVFAPDGSHVGTLEIPASFHATDSGPGWVLGIARGEGDVEYVRMYEFSTP